MDFLAEYGVFLAKTLTLVLAVVFMVGMLVSLGQRQKKHVKLGFIDILDLNERYREMADTLSAAVLSEVEYKALCKQEKKEEKQQRKREKQQAGKGDSEQPQKRRVYVVDFEGDIRASATEALAQQVTAILTQARPEDEVVVRLESPGGMVHGYGLAASQLQRIRDHQIPLTVCVDKVAASGGYMMACLGNRILAAPFAVLGSIGVVAQVPNVHRVLKKYDIDYELFTAGEYKRTVTVFGENTDKAKQKFQQELEDTHTLFKGFVSRFRPSLDIAAVATGETWYGQQALDLHLVDAIQTSDDYLYGLHKQEASLYQVNWVERHSVAERLGLVTESALVRVFTRLLGSLENRGSFTR